MARSRNIKPGFFVNEELGELPPTTRLLFIGLWTLADREGRLEDRPKRIKIQILPADECSVDAALTELERSRFILRYEVSGVRYIQVLNFAKHQTPHHKESASTIPAPPNHRDSGKSPNEITPGQIQRIMDRDGRKCLCCGAKEKLSIDHIVPLSQGGTNDDANLQVLCGTCNSAKGNRHSKDYRQRNNDPITDHKRSDQSAQRPTDSLIPDSLNLIPDSSQTSSASDLTTVETPKIAAPLPPEKNEEKPKPTRAGVIASELRKRGIDTASVREEVIEWAEKNIPDTIIAEAVSIAKERKPGERISSAYLNPIIKQLLDPKPKKVNGSHAWWKDDKSIEAKARELKMWPTSCSTYDELKQKIFDRLKEKHP